MNHNDSENLSTGNASGSVHVLYRVDYLLTYGGQKDESIICFDVHNGSANAICQNLTVDEAISLRDMLSNAIEKIESHIGQTVKLIDRHTIAAHLDSIGKPTDADTVDRVLRALIELQDEE